MTHDCLARRKLLAPTFRIGSKGHTSQFPDFLWSRCSCSAAPLSFPEGPGLCLRATCQWLPPPWCVPPAPAR